jgi:uncharacterized NAD-dependent epimerase/dehydratase family protein
VRILPEHRVAILQHGGIRGQFGKTGLAMLRYSEAHIVAVIDSECAGGSIPALTGIPRDVPIVASLREALRYQPQILVTGIAPPGGALPEAWWQEVKEAVAAGLCIANGLHTPMAEHPEIKPLLREGQWVWDIRREPPNLKLGSGAARELSCLRVLTVGTDMAIGKMSAAIELHRAAKRHGMRSAFVASGQTGIMIAGDGVPLDAVRVDFAAGAVEEVVLRYGREHEILFIEGQGSLLNPASTATLPLIRGSQPTHQILVHRAGADTHSQLSPRAHPAAHRGGAPVRNGCLGSGRVRACPRGGNRAEHRTLVRRRGASGDCPSGGTNGTSLHRRRPLRRRETAGCGVEGFKTSLTM